MKIRIIYIGKTNDPNLIQLEEIYRNRLKFYIPLESIVIPELKKVKNISIAEQKEKEGALVMKNLHSDDEVILLDERGKAFTSKEFSSFIEKKQIANQKNLVFIVGGPYGFSETVYKRANALLSLSKMTFSHQMVRVFFIEQLYRAMTILRGEPYHHE